MNHFVHPLGSCESGNVGDGSRIWAFAHVLPGARIGSDCNVCDHVFIENDVVIGDRVTIKCGVQLWDGIRLEDDVFVGPNATFINDAFPRSKRLRLKQSQTFVAVGASIGANATILSGLRIGQYAMVGAGAVVTRSVPPYAIVVGNPARVVGYVNDAREAGSPAPVQDSFPVELGSIDTDVPGVTLHRMRLVKDLRGNLSVGEMSRDIPFAVKRYFLVFDVPSVETRGEHAHRICHQFLVCVKGRCSVVADDGKQRHEFLLDSPDVGVHLPPMVWGIQYKYSADAVLLVFASEHYDSADYIRDYDEFIALVDAPCQ